MSIPININMGKIKLSFLKKRIPEPKIMERMEFDVFEKASRESYKRWMVPLVDDVLNRLKKDNGKNDLKILDIAFGPGLLIKELAERSTRFSIFGIDNSRYAVKLAKNNCRDLLKKKKVVFKLASVYRIPFPNDYFDLVICKDSLHHFDNIRLALKEMLRIVKPNGMVYIQDLRRDLPWYLLKMAIPPDTAFKKLQYYSARASYTKKEVVGFIKKLGVKKYIIQTRKITDKLGNHYQKIGINLTQLKAAFQSRFVTVFYK